jgi:hypothetical protein
LSSRTLGETFGARERAKLPATANNRFYPRAVGAVKSKAAFDKAAFSWARDLRRLSAWGPAGRRFSGGPSRGTIGAGGFARGFRRFAIVVLLLQA